MSDLTIKTLGGVAFHRDQGEFRPPTRKAAALLVYLGLSPRGSRSREHLADMLWGRSADVQSRASLRQTLSSLRKALGEQADLLESDSDAVGIQCDRLEIDAHEFESLANSASHADLERAAEMYQGAFLEGFSLKEEGFEDWLAFNRQQYNEIALQLFQRLVEHYRMLQEYETALRYAQRLMTLDPLREQTHRLLMELFARLGRRKQALLQYDECEHILKKELDVAPADETRELYASIRTGVALASEHSLGERIDLAHSPASSPSVSRTRAGKPSIAVLPFDNLSGDPAQQYLADAIGEDLVSNLAHDLWFDVIARTSTQKFRDNKTGTADIAAELGTRYIVDGSLRKADDRVRISVVLIDGSDGKQIWNQRYDRVATDLFELQDEIAISIAAAVIPEVNTAEQRSAMRRHPQNLDAWSSCHRAFAHLYTFELPELELAQSLFEQAIEHDPSYSQPYAGLAYSQMMTVWYDSSKLFLLDLANQNARHAIQLNNRDSWAHFALGRVLSMQRLYEEATLELERAIELNPSFGRAYFGLASVAVYAGNYRQALEPIDTAIRLSPDDPHLWTFYNIKSRALVGIGQYEESEYWARKAVRQPSATFWCDLALISALGYLGREDDARPALPELYRKKPGYSLEDYARHDFVLTPAAHQVVVEGLRRAGLPEHEGEALDIPGRPSIAALPFRNLGDDPEQVYFSDGVTEEIITALSRFRWLLVISSNSSFRYRLAKTRDTDVAEELDVRYVVTGSVRKHGNRVRVAAQLIDVASEHQLWADRYDREIDNLFDVQDEIASNIISAVAPESLAAEIKRAEKARCCTLDAWELIMQAHSHWRKLTREHNEEAKQLLQQAIELDPAAAFAHSDLAFCYVFDSMFSWAGSHDQSLANAEQAARKAISIDDRDALGYMALGWVAHKKRDQQAAEDAMNNAINRNPNLADAHGYLAMILGFKGDYAGSKEQAERALRLSPHDPMKTFWFDALAMAAFVSGDYQLAVEWAEKAVQENASYVGALRVLAASYGQTGQLEAAGPVVDMMRELTPGMTCAETALGMPFRNTCDEKRYLQGLRLAGLPQ
jgi:TolB-like protein/DNA-binding SARP family transcriptional activator/Tfp pilus assembly protein PilF